MKIDPADRIVFGQACGEPTTLVEALIAQGAAIGGLSAFIATSFSGLFTPRNRRRLPPVVDGRDRRAAIDDQGVGKLDVIPVHVSQVGPLIAWGSSPAMSR